MSLVAGIDSSTQSCKVVIRDSADGTLLREGRAAHPDGTEVHPEHWWRAATEAIEQAGGLSDVDAVSVAGQQHGMVCLDERGDVVRPALLWNDTRSAKDAAELISESSAEQWARAVGSVPAPSFTVTKLRWLVRNEPEAAARTAAVALPHDWLTWRLAGADGFGQLSTDRSDASGTGYYSPATGQYRRDLLHSALGHDVALPRVLAPNDTAGQSSSGSLLGPGAGDNAAAGLGVGAGEGDVVVSIGTSGTVFAVADEPTGDASGTVAGFADATGRFLPLVCTLNGARVLDATARMLGVDNTELARLALQAPAGSDGLAVVPYLEGERTPARPDATGSVHGLTLNSATPAHLARAAVEGLLCGLADGLDALAAHGVRHRRVILIGGAARNEAVREIAPTIFGCPVVVPPPGEYVADGAARQAAWILSGGAEAPHWPSSAAQTYEATSEPGVRERYAAAREHVLHRVDDPATVPPTT